MLHCGKSCSRKAKATAEAAAEQAKGVAENFKEEAEGVATKAGNDFQKVTEKAQSDLQKAALPIPPGIGRNGEKYKKPKKQENLKNKKT